MFCWCQHFSYHGIIFGYTNDVISEIGKNQIFNAFWHKHLEYSKNHDLTVFIGILNLKKCWFCREGDLQNLTTIETRAFETP